MSARPPLPELARGEDWIIVAKPPRLIVHRTALSSDRVAALQWVRDQVGRKVYPVHRLDRATSGCLLFATRREAAGPLHGALRAPGAHKEYLALVRGCVTPGATTTIDSEIDGKEARTEVTVVASVAEPRSSLVRCRIRTGRFHQVRRHLARYSHPVLGDSHHGGTRINRTWREGHGLPRLALHAWRLELDLPEGRVAVRCPLWPDLRRLLEAWPAWSAALEALPALAEDWATPPPWPGVPDATLVDDGPIAPG